MYRHVVGLLAISASVLQSAAQSQYPSTGLPQCGQLCFDSTVQQGCGSPILAINCICTTPAPVQNMQFCLKSSTCSQSDANEVLQFVLEFCPSATRGLPPGFLFPDDTSSSSATSMPTSYPLTNSTTSSPSTTSTPSQTVVVTTSSSSPAPIIVSETVTAPASSPPDVTLTAYTTASPISSSTPSSASSAPTIQQNSPGTRRAGKGIGPMCLGIVAALLV